MGKNIISSTGSRSSALRRKARDRRNAVIKQLEAAKAVDGVEAAKAEIARLREELIATTTAHADEMCELAKIEDERRMAYIRGRDAALTKVKKLEKQNKAAAETNKKVLDERDEAVRQKDLMVKRAKDLEARHATASDLNRVEDDPGELAVAEAKLAAVTKQRDDMLARYNKHVDENSGVKKVAARVPVLTKQIDDQAETITELREQIARANKDHDLAVEEANRQARITYTVKGDLSEAARKIADLEQVKKEQDLKIQQLSRGFDQQQARADGMRSLVGHVVSGALSTIIAHAKDR